MSREQFWKSTEMGKPEVLVEKLYTACVVVEWISTEEWWNCNGKGNYSTGRKLFYSAFGRWMNVYGATME